jgi:hypothetical protein
LRVRPWRPMSPSAVPSACAVRPRSTIRACRRRWVRRSPPICGRGWPGVDRAVRAGRQSVESDASLVYRGTVAEAFRIGPGELQAGSVDWRPPRVRQSCGGSGAACARRRGSRSARSPSRSAARGTSRHRALFISGQDGTEIVGRYRYATAELCTPVTVGQIPEEDYSRLARVTGTRPAKHAPAER